MVLKNGEEIHLSPLEYNLLLFIYEESGKGTYLWVYFKECVGRRVRTGYTGSPYRHGVHKKKNRGQSGKTKVYSY